MRLPSWALVFICLVTFPVSALAQHEPVTHTENEVGGTHLSSYASYGVEGNVESGATQHEVEALAEVVHHFATTPAFGLGLSLGVRGHLSEGTYDGLLMASLHLDMLRPLHCIIFAGLNLQLAPEVHPLGRFVLHTSWAHWTVAPAFVSALNVATDGALQAEIAPGISIHVGKHDHLYILGQATTPIWNRHERNPGEENAGWAFGLTILHVHNWPL